MSAAGSREELESTAIPAQETGAAGTNLFGRGLLYVVVWSLQLIAGSIISPVLAHVLGPSQFGALALAIAVYQVFTVFAVLGLNQAVTLQRSEDGHDGAARGLITVSIVVSFVMTGILAITAPLWRDAIGFTSHSELLYVVFLWTAPSAAVTSILAFLVAEDRFRIFAVVGAVAAVGGQLAGLLLLFFVHNDATTYAWGAVISQFAAMIIGIVATRPQLRGLVNWRITLRAIRLGFPLILSGLAFFVLNAGDRVVLQTDMGSTQVGRYQIAYVVGSVILLLLGFTDASWIPRLAQERNVERRWELARTSRDELYGLLVPSILGITLATPLTLRIVASPSYHPAGLLLVVFLVALSAFPVVSSDATTRLLTIQRRVVLLGINAGLAAVLNIGLNILLVPTMGVVGSALATLISFAVLAVINRLLMPRTPTWHFPPPRLIIAMVVAVCLAGASILLPQSEPWNIARFVLAVACLPWFFFRLRAARRGPDAVDTGTSTTML